MQETLDYDNNDWSDFYIDPTSKTGLRWNKYSYSGRNHSILEIWPGKEAGSLSNVKNGDNKAWRVFANIEGKYRLVSVHRIIAVLSDMKVNGKVIDHINGITSDNRVENLRVVDQAINSRNCKTQCNSPYGIAGVSSQSDNKGNTYFIARYNALGKRVQKNFPIKALGVMEAFRQAVVFREESIKKLNEQGFGYTERHTSFTEHPVEFSKFQMSNDLIQKATRTIKKRCTNTSGVVGVSFQDNKNGKGTRATARWIDLEGTQRSKSFSVETYGLLPSFALAVEYRNKMIEQLNLEGAGYTYN